MIVFISDETLEKREDGNRWDRAFGIYLHGKVEDYFGFDIVHSTKDGIDEIFNRTRKGDCVAFTEPCHVDGYPNSTELYAWKDRVHGIGGLIVDANDEDARYYAMRMLLNQGHPA